MKAMPLAKFHQKIFADIHLIVRNPVVSLSHRPVPKVLVLGRVGSLKPTDAIQNVSRIRQVTLFTDIIAEFVVEEYFREGFSTSTTFFSATAFEGTWDIVIAQVQARHAKMLDKSASEVLRASNVPIVCREFWTVHPIFSTSSNISSHRSRPAPRGFMELAAA